MNARLASACTLGCFLLLTWQLPGQTLAYWRPSPGTAAWSTSTNWANTSGGSSGGNVPNTSSEIAVFNTSTRTTLTFSGNLVFGGMRFESGAPAYTFTVGTRHEILTDGITNNSSNAPTFNLTTGSLTFQGGSAANSIVNITDTGYIAFSGATATGGTATLTLSSSDSYADFTGSTNSSLTLGSLSGAGSVYLGDYSLSVGGNNASTTFSGAIRYTPYISTPPTSGITKVGTGTLTLSGTNVYTGDTTISAGTLVMGSSGAFGSSTVVLNGGTLNFGSQTSVSLGGLAGSGNLTLANDSSATVMLTVGSNHQSTTYSGALNGAGSLTKTGDGALTLTGANSHAGTTLLSGGSVRFGAGALSANSNLQFNGGSIDLITGGPTNFTLGGGGGQVQWLTSGGFGAYGGNQTVTLNGGAVLTWGSNHFVPSGTTLVLGTATSNGTITLANAIDLGSATRTIQVNHGSATLDAALSGVLSGTAGFDKTGVGSLALTGANNYTGTTRISDGAIRLDTTSTIPAGSNIQFNGGVLELGTGAPTDFTLGSGGGQLSWVSAAYGGFSAVGANRTVTFNGGAALTAWGVRALALSSATSDATITLANAIDFGGNRLYLNVNDGSATTDAILSGVLSGSSGLTKSGAGALALTGTNTYAGSTQLLEGTLEFASLANLGSSPAIQLYGGTLRYPTGFTTDLSPYLKGGDLAIDTNGNNVSFAQTVMDGGSPAASLYKYGAGTLTLNGAGSDFFFHFRVNGGTVAMTSSGSAGDLHLGYQDNSQGELKISGSGVAWTLGEVSLGYGAGSTGTLTVTDSASVNAGGLFGVNVGIAGTGAITISNGASFTANYLDIGIGGNGTVLIDNASASVTQLLRLGLGSGNSGSLTLQNGGMLTTPNGLAIGRVENSPGSVTITGTGSVLTTSGNIDVGYYGNGSLTISNGGVLNTGYATVGRDSVATGTVLITGAGSAWNVNAENNGLHMEYRVANSITLADGGALNMTGLVDTLVVGNQSTFRLGTGGIASDLNATVISPGTFIIDNSNTVTLSKLFSLYEGTGTLTKSGTGTAILAGGFAHSGAGAVQVTGTLQIGNGGSVSDLGGAYTLNSNANLVFNTSGSGGIAGAITGSGSVTLRGGGAMSFNTASSYTGTTTILGTANIFGALAVSGGVSSFGNATSPIIVGDATQAGILSYSGGTATFTRGLTLGAAGGTFTNVSSGAVTFGTGGLALGGPFTLDGNGTVTMSSVLSGSGGFTKGGTTNLTISGTNTYTGATQLSGGTTTISSLANVGGGASSLGAPTDATNGLIRLGSGSTSTALSYSGSGSTSDRGIEFVGTTGALTISSNGSGPLALTGALTFSGAGTKTLTLGGTNTGANSLGGVIADNSAANKTNLVKGGAGLWLVGTANTYTGSTTISGGTLSVGKLANGGSNSSVGASSNAAANLVINNATLRYTGSGDSTDRLFTLGTSGATLDSSGTGALVFNNTGSLVMSGTSARTLTLTGSNADANTLTSNLVNPSSGNLSLTKTGAGTWVLGGTNTHAGATTINDGTLKLGSSTALQSSAVTINATTAGTTAALDLNNYNATVSSLAFGGTGSTSTSTHALSTGTGTLTVANTGTITFSATGNSLGSTLSGKLELGTGAHTFSIGDSSNAAVDLAVSAIVSGSGTLTKSSAGTMVFSGANTYTGATAVTAGVLNIRHDSALGTAAAGTSVSSGAALQLQGGITVTGETLSLAGTGIAADGALRNISGTNNWTGAVTLTAASRIQNDAGQLTLGGGVSGATFGLTVAGAGNTILSGGIATTTGGLTKNDAGILTLNGASTYTGATAVNAGTLILNGSLANTTVTIASGATLGGSGTIAGATTLSAGSTLTPGNSPGLLTVTNNLTLLGTTLMELAAAGTRGTAFDGIDVSSGTLSFGGTLTVSLLGGFTPAAGNTFDLFDFTSGSGAFTTLNLPTLSGGLTWNTSALYTTGVISVSTSAIPEPSTYAALAGLAALLLALHRRRQQQQV